MTNAAGAGAIQGAFTGGAGGLAGVKVGVIVSFNLIGGFFSGAYNRQVR